MARKLASLHELETIYSYEDAMKMAEIITVQNYNEWLAQNRAEAVQK